MHLETRLLALVFLTLLALQHAMAKVCMDTMIPTKVNTENAKFNATIPQDAFELGTFVISLIRQGFSETMSKTNGTHAVRKTFHISAKICWPGHSVNNASVHNLQVLTAGIGYDKSYWHLPYNNYNYSYLKTATDEFGYATLSYDRLGVGKSSRADPLNEIQAPSEVAVLMAITDMARKGKIPGVRHPFAKVYHVGQSIGSALTYVATSQNATGVSDGIILTAFSLNATYVPLYYAGTNFQFANQVDPTRFGALSNGYYLSGDIRSDIFDYAYPPNIDNGIMEAFAKTKQTVTIGELLSLGAAVPYPSAFSGPVLFIAGQHDLPFCGGNCLDGGSPGMTVLDQSKPAFPNASTFTTYVQPSTGHGMTSHYNATEGYRYMNTWLSTYGSK